MLFGKVALVGVLLGTLSSSSLASSAAPSSSGAYLPLNPNATADLSLPTVPVQAQSAPKFPHFEEAPTAPLPSAFWSGVAFLATLGSIRVVRNARQRIARG